MTAGQHASRAAMKAKILWEQWMICQELQIPIVGLMRDLPNSKIWREGWVVTAFSGEVTAMPLNHIVVHKDFNEHRILVDVKGTR
jgi:hypothetical protein